MNRYLAGIKRAMKRDWLQLACVTLLFLLLSAVVYAGEVHSPYKPSLELVKQLREDKNLSRFYEQYANQPYGRERLEKTLATLGPGSVNIRPGQNGEQEKIRERQVPSVEAKQVIRPSVRAVKPEWKVGYQWHYAWKEPGRSGTLTREIIREDTFEGIPSYVVRIGTNEHFYAKDVLGLLASMTKEKLVFKRTPPSRLLSWPLEVGKEWKDTYVRESPEEKSSKTFNYRTMVANVGEVKVPAGIFEAFKIETYGFHSDRLAAEYWYSPRVKWFVKERTFHPGGVLERELTGFKID